MTKKYSGKTGIFAKLEKEYVRTVESEYAQRISELKTLAVRYAKPRQLFPGGVVTATMGFLTGLAFTGMGAFILWKVEWRWNNEFFMMSDGTGEFFLAYFATVLGALLTIQMVRYFLRLKKPLLSLGPDGVELWDGAITLPWIAIMRYEVFLNKHSGIIVGTTLTLFLHIDVPAPKHAEIPAPTLDIGPQQLRYDKKHHTIMLSTIKFAGLDRDALDDLFGNYLRAGLARVVLRNLTR
jgi:hypothetical protein